MANNTDGQFGARIVEAGSGRIITNQQIGEGTDTFVKGDFVRINTSGELQDAKESAGTVTSPVHGMIVEDWSTAPTSSQYPKWFKFEIDTIIEMQVHAAAGADAQPQDCLIGTSYELKKVAAGRWSVDAEEVTNPIVTIVAQPSVKRWFEVQAGAAINFGIVHVKLFSQAMIDGRYAAD